MSKPVLITLWIFSVVLAGLFLLGGVNKVIGGEEVRAQFAAWGYAPWFATLLGVLEIAGGIGLLVPRLAFLAACGLIPIMGGAVYTHLKTEGEAAFAIVPAVVLVALVPIAIARWRQSPLAPRPAPAPESL